MMREEPLVSIIIPSYNHEKYIRECIESVLNQSYSHIEVLICDDYSLDGTRDKIDSFNDDRIRKYYRECNVGAVTNLNLGIEAANGKYVAILNSDDYWHRDKLRLQVSFLETHLEYGAVFSNCEFISEKGKRLTRNNYSQYDIFNQENRTRYGWLRKLFFEQNCICHPSVLVRKELYREAGLYDPRFRQLPDFKMWINILKIKNIYIMPEKLVCFRILNKGKNASAQTVENDIRTKNELILLLKEFFFDMSLECFVNTFEEDLINKSISTVDQMACEQAFLYLKLCIKLNLAYSILAINRFYELLQDHKTRQILANEYQFTYNDFFTLTGKSNLCTLNKYDVYIKNEMSILDKVLFLLKKIRDILKKQ